MLQVVRGGQFPEIRTRSTLSALKKLAARGLMTADTAARLADGTTVDEARRVLIAKIGEKIWVLLDDAGMPVKTLTPSEAGAAARKAGAHRSPHPVSTVVKAPAALVKKIVGSTAADAATT